MNNDLVGLIIGFVLTLFIFSYIWGDNPLYRLAVHILVGVSAGYAAVVLVQQLFAPLYAQFQTNPRDAATLVWIIPGVLGFLLVFKRLPRVAWMGTWSLALLMGVGAAVSLLGAFNGTLLPQIISRGSNGPALHLIVAVLTVATLATFQFTGRLNRRGEWERPFWQWGLAGVGQAVLMITFGALFATVLNTSLILLIERLHYFLTQFTQVLS